MHRVYLNFQTGALLATLSCCMLFEDKSKSFPFCLAPTWNNSVILLCLQKCCETCFVSKIKFQLQPHGCLVGQPLNDNRKSIVLISWNAVAFLCHLQHLDCCLNLGCKHTLHTCPVHPVQASALCLLESCELRFTFVHLDERESERGGWVREKYKYMSAFLFCSWPKAKHVFRTTY